MNISKRGFLIGIVLAVVVSGLYLGYIVTRPIVENTVISIMEEKRVPVLVVGDADPGLNVTGFFYFMIYKHQAAPLTAYASNLSNFTITNDCYEYSDSSNTSATGETPYGTTFDIIVKVGVNKNDGCTSSNSTWNESMMWCNLTCADLGIGADTNMSELFIAQGGTYYSYVHYYLNNGGAGYTVIEGQSFNVTAIKFYVQRLS